MIRGCDNVASMPYIKNRSHIKKLFFFVGQSVVNNKNNVTTIIDDFNNDFEKLKQSVKIYPME